MSEGRSARFQAQAFMGLSWIKRTLVVFLLALPLLSCGAPAEDQGPLSEPYIETKALWDKDIEVGRLTSWSPQGWGEYRCGLNVIIFAEEQALATLSASELEAIRELSEEFAAESCGNLRELSKAAATRRPLVDRINACLQRSVVTDVSIRVASEWWVHSPAYLQPQ